MILFQHFVGRRRNCYTIAIRIVHRALVFATKGRKLKKEDLNEVIERFDSVIDHLRKNKKILISVT